MSVEGPIHRLSSRKSPVRIYNVKYVVPVTCVSSATDLDTGQVSATRAQ